MHNSKPAIVKNIIAQIDISRFWSWENGNKVQQIVSIGLFTRVCRSDVLVLNWPGKGIYENSLEQPVSARISLFGHPLRLVRARLNDVKQTVAGANN